MNKNTTSKEAYEQYNQFLNEPAKPVNAWAKDDKEIKEQKHNFIYWFKEYKKLPNAIVYNSGAGRGVVILTQKQWDFIKELYFKRTLKKRGFKKGSKKWKLSNGKKVMIDVKKGDE